jgi:hypothetical protein
MLPLSMDDNNNKNSNNHMNNNNNNKNDNILLAIYVNPEISESRKSKPRRTCVKRRKCKVSK